MASRSNSEQVERATSPMATSHHDVVIEVPAAGDAEQLGFPTRRFAEEGRKSSLLRPSGAGNERNSAGPLPGGDSGPSTNIMNTMVSDQRLQDYDKVLAKQKTADQVVEPMD